MGKSYAAVLIRFHAAKTHYPPAQLIEAKDRSINAHASGNYCVDTRARR